jgi:hypothetical protein
MDSGMPRVECSRNRQDRAKEKKMFLTVKKIIKWASIPVLLVASLFACCTAGYEPLVDGAIGLGAIVFIVRAVWFREYFWAAGFLAIAAVFSPLSLAMKILVLMGFTCIATIVTLLAAFRTQPLLVD